MGQAGIAAAGPGLQRELPAHRQPPLHGQAPAARAGTVPCLYFHFRVS